LFSIGLYVCAISLAQDSSLRKTIRKSKIGLVDNIGIAQMEQEVRKRVLKMVEEGKDKMEEQTGGLSYSVTEKDLREYVELVIDERKQSTMGNKKKSYSDANEWRNGKYSST
jgi:hypothetical protein